MNPPEMNPPEEGFFAFLQRIEHEGIEHANTGQPLLGESLRLQDDPVRLGQHSHLDFASCDIKRTALLPMARGRTVRKFYLQNFGLLGPHGALPLHYTEHACNRLHHWNDPTFSEFLDIFHHRIYLLFYRAWAQAQPNVAYHRDQGNVFSRNLNALLGHQLDGRQCREVLPPNFRASQAAHFSRYTKTMEGLISIVTACTGQPVHVHSFQARWLQLGNPRESKPLGQGAMLGSRAWCAQSGVGIQLGPMQYSAYLDLLPGKQARTQLKQAVLAYLGLEFDCEFLFDIHAHEIPPARLNGRAGLGHTAWLGAVKQANCSRARVRMKCG